MRPVPREVAGLMLRVVSLTFGGGSAIMGALRLEMVERRGWLTEQQFGACYGVSRLTPGTNIFAYCVGAGWLLGSGRGALLALLAASVPCTVIMVTALAGYDAARDNSWLAAALRGAMAAAIGVILASAWAILQPYLKGSSRSRNAALFVASAVLMMGFGLSPVPILLVAGLFGFLWPEGRQQ